MSLFKKVGAVIGTAVGSVAGATEYRYRTLINKEDNQTAKENATKTKMSVSTKVGETAGDLLEIVGPVVTTAGTSHLTGRVLGKSKTLKRLK